MFAVKVTEPPSQKVVEPDAVIVATGLANTFTAVGNEVVEQPAALVTVKVTVCDVLTAIDEVVSPVDHK